MMHELRKTALHEAALQDGAKMAPFAGWLLPLHFGSQVNEHHAVRNAAGLFDVSHMAVLDVVGSTALAFLRLTLAGDVGRLGHTGEALYTVLLNEQGGVIDDLIVYRRPQGYRLVVNAGPREKVIAWLAGHAGRGVQISERDLSMLALQGPGSLEILAAVQGADALGGLKPFRAKDLGGVMLARTGYTGEDGVEILLPNDAAPELWRRLVRAGAQPCGLGARDSLRLEAGYRLNGQDMDEATTPLEAGLGKCVHWSPPERDFIGRRALAAQQAAGPSRKLFGLVLRGRGVMRPGHQVVAEQGEGVITSGLFSPSLGYSIALTRLPCGAKGAVQVFIRNQPKPAQLVQPPFVRRRQAAFQEIV